MGKFESKSRMLISFQHNRQFFIIFYILTLDFFNGVYPDCFSNIFFWIKLSMAPPVCLGNVQFLNHEDFAKVLVEQTIQDAIDFIHQRATFEYSPPAKPLPEFLLDDDNIDDFGKDIYTLRSFSTAI